MGIFRQGRYAAVAATAALVISMSGTSYALVLVTGADIKDGTVGGRDIKNHSVKLMDLSPRTIQGLRGATGPIGPPGVPGPTTASVLYLEQTLSTATSGGEYVPATCPEGSTPVTLFVPEPETPASEAQPAGVNFASNYMLLDLEHRAIKVKIFANNPPTPSTREVVLVCAPAA